jgi:hypothetical protein
MSAQRRERWVAVATIAAVLALVAIVTFDRARRVVFDFSHFYLEAQYIWAYGDLDQDPAAVDPKLRPGLPFYLPTARLAAAGVLGGSVTTSALIWSVLQVASFGIALALLWRWFRFPDHRAPPAIGFVVAVAIALPAIFEAAKFNQLSFMVLALVVAGITLMQQRHAASAGVCFAVAAIIKLLPAVFLPWLLLKRRWRAAGAFALASVLLIALPPAIAFGPQDAWRYHVRWFNDNVAGVAKQGLAEQGLRGHFTDHRNQSLGDVLRRSLQQDFPAPAPRQFAQLSAGTVTALAGGVAVVLLAAGAWATRRSWQALATPQPLTEFAAVSLAMLIFAPLLRQYYLVWALPALILLARRAVEYDPLPGRGLARIGVLLWVLGQLAWLSDYARTYGVHLVMLILLAVVTLRVGRVAAASAPKDEPAASPETRTSESSTAPARRPAT